MTQSLPPKSLVLYVDDDPEDIELIQEAFESQVQNVELVTFDNAVDLLRYIDMIDPFQPAPCLFIIDINMPGIDGKEMLKRVRRRKEFADVPAVLFSTSTLPADAAFAEKHNAGFVTKPLVYNQVHVIVDQIIDHCSDEVKKMIRKQNGK